MTKTKHTVASTAGDKLITKITKIAVFVGCGNKNAHGQYRTNYTEMAVALFKSKPLFLSFSKLNL